MKKNIYIAVISSLTVFCIIYGTWINVSGFFNTTKNHIWRGFNNIKIYDTSDSNNGNKNDQMTLEAFSEISININIGEVKIEEGSDYSIKYAVSSNWLIPKFEVSNGILSISQPSKKNKGGNNNCSITITVPSTCELKKSDIDVDIGDIKISGINSKEIKADVNIGELKIADCEFDSAVVEVDVGDIRISGLHDIESYSYDLKASIGDVKCNGNQKRQYKSTGTDSKKYIRADVDVGDIKIN